MRYLGGFAASMAMVFCLTFASAAAANVSLEWPYTVALANLTAQVEQCTKVSGFRFRNNSQPNVQQLAKMCADPSCGNITTQLMKQRTGVDLASFTAAFTYFTVPMVDYCWYMRLPNTPCPANAYDDFFSHEVMREKDANCARVTGISMMNMSSTFINHNGSCTADCEGLAERIYYLYYYMPCVRGANPKLGMPIIGAFFIAATCFREHTFMMYTYRYRPGWPVPPVPEESTSAPPAFFSSGSDASTSGSGETALPPQVDPIEVGDPGSYIEDHTPSLRTRSPTNKPSISTENSSSQSGEAQESLSVGTTTAQGKVTDKTTQIPNQETSSPQQARTPVAPDGSKTNLRLNHNYVEVVGALAFSVLVVVGLILFVRRKRARASAKAARKSPSDSDYSTLDSPSRDTGEESSPIDGFVGSDGVSTIKKVLGTKYVHDVRMIGTGGYGVVYLVRDTLNNRILASKRLSQNDVTDDKIDEFYQEIRLVSKLQHPCVVTFVGATWTNRTDVQALFEYMDGGDLRTYLDTTPVTETWTTEKLTIAMDIANALVYVHSELPKPLVHRDLKSRNVLLSKSPLRAKLSDFGVAREVSQNESMTNGVGTSRWLAPEVILGRGDYGTACDVYSFGVVLSELDTHKIPFWDCGGDGLDSMLPEIAIMRMVALEGRQPTFSASCPPVILDLARQCLAHNPQERPTARAIATILGDLKE